MTKHIFRVEVEETLMPKRANWRANWDEEYEESAFKVRICEEYFPNFEEVKKYVDTVTEGCHQAFATVRKDMYEEDAETLEYHNGKAEWDKEFIIDVSQVKLIDSLLEAIRRQEQGV